MIEFIELCIIWSVKAAEIVMQRVENMLNFVVLQLPDNRLTNVGHENNSLKFSYNKQEDFFSIIKSVFFVDNTG